jgi:aspartate 1-decarboxylase
MFIKVLRAKIHRATATGADLDYIGSITIDRELLDASGIVEGESVLVANLSNGTRHETYVICGPRGGGEVTINGAAARLVGVGDRLIIMAFAYAEMQEAARIEPRIVLVDDRNRPVRML